MTARGPLDRLVVSEDRATKEQPAPSHERPVWVVAVEGVQPVPVFSGASLHCAHSPDGPAIVAAAVWRRRMESGNSLQLAIGGLAVASLWSVCSGLVVLDLAVSAGRSLF